MTGIDCSEGGGEELAEEEAGRVDVRRDVARVEVLCDVTDTLLEGTAS